MITLNDRTMEALSEPALFALALLLDGSFFNKEESVSELLLGVFPAEGIEFGTIIYN